MSRGDEDLEDSASEIDLVSVVDDGGNLEGLGPIAGGVEVGRQWFPDPARADEFRDGLGSAPACTRPRVRSVTPEHLVEEVIPTDMVIVRVGIEHQYVEISQSIRYAANVAYPESGIEQQRTLVTHHEKGYDLFELARFIDSEDTVRDHVHLEPFLGLEHSLVLLPLFSRKRTPPFVFSSTAILDKSVVAVILTARAFRAAACE